MGWQLRMEELGSQFGHCVKVGPVVFTDSPKSQCIHGTDRQEGRKTDRKGGKPSALEYLMLSLGVWADGATRSSPSHLRCSTIGWSGDVSSSLDHANRCHISQNSHFTGSIWLGEIRIAFGTCYFWMPGGSTGCYFPFRNRSRFALASPAQW